MWIVLLALRRPFTVGVMAILILVMGALSVARMQVDIFPSIDIPVVGVLWNYPGMSAEDMERRVVVICERAFSATVNGIARIESNSIPGIGIIKIYFQPGSDIGGAIAQISAVTQTILRIAPPGMTAPLIIQVDASSVPVAQMTLSSDTLPEERIFDYGFNFIRLKLFTIPGLSTPSPYGGKSRQINVDIDLRSLSARGLSPIDVVNAIQSANVILPAGTARMGDREYNINTNNAVASVSDFNNIPVRVLGRAPVLLGQVATISDSFADQTNIVRVNGRRATYLAILKHANASTLAVVDAARAALPDIRALAPPGLEVKLDFDQSLFVRAAISGVVREGLITSVLVSLMIGFFLGSFRSIIIVCTSIPLAIFSAIIGLSLTGNTINIMTLGGLSLAIGMLVDDATVAVENIDRNRHLGKPLLRAILDGASQVATPAIVATLSVCIVFFPVVLLSGPARYLFVPLALSVVMAMLASYVLSRTLVPSLSHLLLRNEAAHTSRFALMLERVRERVMGRLQGWYGATIEALFRSRRFVLTSVTVAGMFSLALVFVVGTDFFPAVDAGLMKLHFRAPNGSRIEKTEAYVAQVEQVIREVIPVGELDTINSMIGVPTFFNLGFVQSDNVRASDAEILVALKPGHRPSDEYKKAIREKLEQALPGTDSYFQPGDIVNQVLNFGLAAPLDIQIEYRDFGVSGPIAKKLVQQLRTVPGVADPHLVQGLDYPTLNVEVDRQRAAQVGLAQRDVAQSLLVSLSSSALVSPSYYLNLDNGVNYTVAVKTPLAEVDSVGTLMSTPLTTPGQLLSSSTPSVTLSAAPSSGTQRLSSLATVAPGVTMSQVSHYTVQRVLDVAASIEGRDLGSTVADINAIIAGLGQLPLGMKITVRGQNQTMNESFRLLGLGLILAILLVYCLMVVLYQSWIDPLIILLAVPGAFVGILWMLAITGSTINVESLMGSIMAVGIAVSNSILLVNFANELRYEQNLGPAEAAALAGKTRLRPVIMTALAMIIGMIPMALGLGEAGEQNAPLARAVIGGLLAATFVTLFVVPLAYSAMRIAPPTKHKLDEVIDAEIGSARA